MGYSTRNGGQIKTFWPDETNNEFYIERTASIVDIMALIISKWPGTPANKISIEAEYIHTDYLTCDNYEASDYTNFLRIYKNGN